MKPKSIQSLLAVALLAPGALFAQTTATTTPVGYVSLGDTTAGQPACKAETDVFISIPLSKPAVASGVATSINSGTNTITASAAAFGDFTTTPHVVTITSGAAKGLVALISASTATTIGLSLQPGDSINGLAVSDTFSISPAWTVLGLLGTDLPVGVSLLTLPASGAPNPSAEGIYDWDGTNWVDNVVTGAPADNDVLFPNETFILRNASQTPIASLIVSGEVPVYGSRVHIAASSGATDYAVSYFSPVSEGIGSSGLSDVASIGDSLLGFDNNAPGFNKSASIILDYDGAGNWIDNVVTGEPDNSFPLGQGVGYIYRRVGSAPASNWSDLQNFIAP